MGPIIPVHIPPLINDFLNDFRKIQLCTRILNCGRYEAMIKYVEDCRIMNSSIKSYIIREAWESARMNNELPRRRCTILKHHQGYAATHIFLVPVSTSDVHSGKWLVTSQLLKKFAPALVWIMVHNVSNGPLLWSTGLLIRCFRHELITLKKILAQWSYFSVFVDISPPKFNSSLINQIPMHRVVQKEPS